MSYSPGTILTRTTPFAPPEPGADTLDLTPYNEIEVVGPSPVSDQVRSSEFAGQLGNDVSIKPTGTTGFAPVIDRPQGELQRDYTVKTLPEPRTIARGVVEVVEPGPSPEEVFAEQSAATPAPQAPAQPDPDAPSPEDVFAQAASGS